MKIVDSKMMFSKEDASEFTKEESKKIDKCIEEYNEQTFVNLYIEPLEIIEEDDFMADEILIRKGEDDSTIVKKQDKPEQK